MSIFILTYSVRFKFIRSSEMSSFLEYLRGKEHNEQLRGSTQWPPPEDTDFVEQGVSGEDGVSTVFHGRLLVPNEQVSALLRFHAYLFRNSSVEQSACPPQKADLRAFLGLHDTRASTSNYII